MPGWIADKQKRLAKIRDARQALEAEAAAAAKPNAQRRSTKGRETQALGAGSSPALKEPDPKAQRNFTDPDSRVLLTKDGFDQGFHNAQAAVDGTKQIIVAHGLTQSRRLSAAFPWSTPSGPASGASPERFRRTRAIAARPIFWRSRPRIRAYVATGRAKHPAETTRKVGGAMTQTMRQKLKRAGYRSRYRLRSRSWSRCLDKIKQARGFRQFLLRGLEAVKAEWALICTAHNITKLAKAI